MTTANKDTTTLDIANGKVLVGNCLDRLKELPDASVDSIVSDPPYELGFMGKQWDASGIAYNVELWRECLRVLKPGGHLLAFGGTRTYHRMAVAIEDAGFEVRDSIHWLYGSGFPKSLNVGKAIEAQAKTGSSSPSGQRKAAMGDDYEPTPLAGTPGYGTTGNFSNKDTGSQPLDITTDAAKTWSGWGTALKPAHEPIVVARKPLAGTVAANVLAHGTGALNIDGCRVGSEVRNNPPRATKDGSPSLGGGWTATEGTTATGRWPANIVFTHAAECRLVAPGGTETVRETANLPDIRNAKMHAGADRGTVEREVATYKDTPAVWACAPGCPVAELDAQSGIRPTSSGLLRRHTALGSMNDDGWQPQKQEAQMYGDTGGASRFFTVTEWSDLDAPFRYVAKPGKKERNAGLDGMPVVKTAAMAGNLVSGQPLAGDGTPIETPERQNFHPTVKPVALMRWLVRLVTPPNGTVLDPFLGSGTTAVAAELEGFAWVGCEMTVEYLPIIEGRVTHAGTHTNNAPTKETKRKTTKPHTDTLF